MNDKIKFLIIGAVSYAILQAIIVGGFYEVKHHKSIFHKTEVKHEKRGNTHENRKRSNSGYGYDDDQYDSICRRT